MEFSNDTGTLKLTVAACQCGKLQIGNAMFTIHHQDLKELAKIFNVFSQVFAVKEYYSKNQDSYNKSPEKAKRHMLLVE
ncbi:MAG: hypothetical protein AB8G05_00405 [Oligoflexales bacterium]